MSLQEGVKIASDVINKAEKTAEVTVKKTWSILDAATEKMKPSDQLSQDAIRKIQGNKHV